MQSVNQTLNVEDSFCSSSWSRWFASDASRFTVSSLAKTKLTRSNRCSLQRNKEHSLDGADIILSSSLVVWFAWRRRRNENGPKSISFCFSLQFYFTDSKGHVGGNGRENSDIIIAQNTQVIFLGWKNKSVSTIGNQMLYLECACLVPPILSTLKYWRFTHSLVSRNLSLFTWPYFLWVPPCSLQNKIHSSSVSNGSRDLPPGTT